MQFKTVTTQGAAKLVEYTDPKGKLRRAVLPIEAVDVESGIPYGADFGSMLKAVGTAEVVDSVVETLHQYGIWTAEDALQHSGVVLSAGKHFDVDSSIILRAVVKEVTL